MYIVAKYFTDLQDGDHPYKAGESFPREGLEVTEARLAELSGKNNKRGEVLIKAEEPAEEQAERKPEKPAEEITEEPKKTAAAKANTKSGEASKE